VNINPISFFLQKKNKFKNIFLSSIRVKALFRRRRGPNLRDILVI